MTKLIDVTGLVGRGWEDDEVLQVTQCICGSPQAFIISIYEKDAQECPACGRKFICRQSTAVYEVQTEDTPPALRTCGNCGWLAVDKQQLNWGYCIVPLPIGIDARWNPLMFASTDASVCPYWKEKP